MLSILHLLSLHHQHFRSSLCLLLTLPFLLLLTCPFFFFFSFFFCTSFSQEELSLLSLSGFSGATWPSLLDPQTCPAAARPLFTQPPPLSLTLFSHSFPPGTCHNIYSRFLGIFCSLSPRGLTREHVLSVSPSVFPHTASWKTLLIEGKKEFEKRYWSLRQKKKIVFVFRIWIYDYQEHFLFFFSNFTRRLPLLV